MKFDSVSNLWNKWNIRGFVMLSLWFQVFLTLFASLRKKTNRRPIVFLLWFSYLMADSVAAFTIGLISHNQGSSRAHAAEIDGSLQAFWASFLLLHLGGPDTIAAFSLEDSALWRRHLLTIIFQCGAAVYVFVQIFLSDKSLVIPTMLVLFVGVIKNAERLMALYFSSLPRLRESMMRLSQSQLSQLPLSQLPLCQLEYVKLIEELNVEGGGNSNEEEAKLAERIVVKHAYYFYRNFKFFLGEIVTSEGECYLTREYFNKVSAVDALRVILVQLHFIYEVLYTKALVIHSKWSCIFRFIAFTSLVMALVLFNYLKKHQLPKLDVEITHILLFGGIALDVMASLMLVFSYWTVAKIKRNKTGSFKLDAFPLKLIPAMAELSKLQFGTCEANCNADVTYAVLDTPFISRCWSESISGFNLLSEFFKKRPTKMYKDNRCWGIITFSYICCFPFDAVEEIISYIHQTVKTIAKAFRPSKQEVLIANTRYVSKNPFIKELWIFIFKEVRRKSKDVDNLANMKVVFEARGDLFLRSRPEGIDCDNLLEYLTPPINFDHSVLTWHLATEIWYNREKQLGLTTKNDEREFSKILSDYMLYLFLNQENLVYPVLNIFQIRSAKVLSKLQEHIRDTRDVEGLCNKLYEDSHLLEVLGPEGQLAMGIKLAREMEGLQEMKWKVMSGVWVEMLSYAAGHTKVESHLQVPGKGGELLTIVWLLMVHFGLFNYVSDIPSPSPSPKITRHSLANLRFAPFHKTVCNLI